MNFDRDQFADMMVSHSADVAAMCDTSYELQRITAAKKTRKFKK